MTAPDLPAIIARLRRTQPRNLDTMAVCDAAEAMTATLRLGGIPTGFDRAAYHREYQRAYMRDARAARKLGLTTAEYRRRNQ